MSDFNFKKPILSITEIGNLRFWVGLIAGIIITITISFLFNYTRETLRFITGIHTDLYVPTKGEFTFFNYFFTALSTVIGLSVSITIWLRNLKHHRINERFYKLLSTSNALTGSLLILMLITRIGTTIALLVYGAEGYDNELKLYNEYWLIFLLIPLFIFGNSWYTVRMVYNSSKWILLSFVICLSTTVFLANVTKVDQSIVNESYFSQFKEDYNYIDNEIEKARNEYGVYFLQETIETLKKWKTYKSSQQVEDLRRAFNRNNKLTLDTIILQRMVIHNLKECNYFDYWPYVSPVKVFIRLKNSKADSPEAKELVFTLNEMIKLVNTPKIDYEKNKYITKTEERKGIYVNYMLPARIPYQLKLIRDSILMEKRFFKYYNQLPEIKFKERYRN